MWPKKEKLNDETDLSPEELTQLRHRRVRVVRQNPEVLSDLPMELFLRLVGLFYTIDSSVRASPKYGDAAKKFEELRLFIDSQLANVDGKNFAKYEMADYVHNLHLLLVGVLPIDHLEANIPNIREEYHGHVDENTFKTFTESCLHDYLIKSCCSNSTDLDKELYESRLRTEYKNLINEIRRARLFEEHIESTRAYLMRSVSKTYGKLILLPFLVILYYVYYTNTHHIPDKITLEAEWLNGFCGVVLVALAAISGATGSLISVLLRIQGVQDNSQLAQNIVAFKYSENAIRLAPLTGLIFAISLSLIFSGNLIGGTIFPKDGSWSYVISHDNEVSSG
ncbi:MAG TPA: hypothetical protein VJ844_11845 [Mucilaginibacter sp.]|nr:hypothetical protein [Mucilaginibacter sp.]